MAKDHYVAQTYLKHFTDAEGKLHAYSKKDGKYFTPGPKGVCTEWDGDSNAEIAAHPELLGEFRKIFEPHWNPTVQELQKRNAPKDVRMVVAHCYAHMMTCVPAWRRAIATTLEGLHENDLHIRHLLNEARDMKDEVLAEAVQALNNKEIKLVAEPDVVKARVTLHLMQHVCLVYHANWLFFENKTDTPFITSDNPVVLNVTDRIGKSLTRFMAITPSLGLLMRLDPELARKVQGKSEAITNLMQKEPTGMIRGTKPSPKDVRMLNRRTVQCAEDFVFSNRKDDGIQYLVKKYANYRIEPEFQKWKEADNSYIHGFVMQARPRTD